MQDEKETTDLSKISGHKFAPLTMPTYLYDQLMPSARTKHRKTESSELHIGPNFQLRSLTPDLGSDLDSGTDCHSLWTLLWCSFERVQNILVSSFKISFVVSPLVFMLFLLVRFLHTSSKKVQSCEA
jgi:hypothetical protein